MTQESQDRSAGKKALWVLFFMAAAFGAPYLAVYSFINSDDLLSSFGKSNHGKIISPARPLDGGPYRLADGEAFNIDENNGEWTILTIGQSACIDQCRDNVISMRQVRKALGVNRRHVHRVFLSLDGKPFSATVADDAHYFDGMKNIVETDSTTSALLSKFSVDYGPSENAVYLIDFKGNIMMYYKPGTEPKDILADLERLFKVFKPK
ncbi:MAG: SCO family protein [Pseudomonadales bacterium]|nr:SCO family protein [Pseudomonadales bacterium]